MTFSLELKEGLAIAWSAIRANKLRSGLTTLGVVIGIVTVTLMGTAIEALSKSFKTTISQMGTDVLYVCKYSPFDDEPWWLTRNRRDFQLSYGRELERLSDFARVVVPEAFTPLTVRRENASASGITGVGTTDNNFLARGFTIAEGRFFSAAESDGGRRVCVLGADVAKKFFPKISPIGQRLYLGGHAFEVVGVMTPMDKFLGLGSDDHVIFPIQQLLSLFDNHSENLQFLVKVNDLDKIEDHREELRGFMRRIRRLAPLDKDDFFIVQQDAFLDFFNRVGGTIAAAGLFITGLSLFVGGIGIMNIMFVSVAERTREIGIRKAIGAKRRTILMQFLMEAAAICLIGGLIGLAIAFPVTLGMAKVLPASLSMKMVAISLSVSVATGLISGFLPAWRAAKMNPVDALRSE